MNFGPYTVGYCTNVHAGTNVPTISANLEKYAVAVRDQLGHDQSLGVGLWIPNQASCELATAAAARDFREFLDRQRLNAFTINGFPYDNFHQDVVKHRVYIPAWWEPARLEYTQRLAEILAILLPESEQVGSISTLPIGWPSNPEDANLAAGQETKLYQQAGKHLRQMATSLQKLESRTGRRIVLAIEPEPGCILDTSADLVDWFDQHLPDQWHRKYITVCHDVCHAAVMMESQTDVLQRFARAGIGIGKIQISSAIVADFAAMDHTQQAAAKQQLAEFAEDRYLHQTGRRTSSGEFALAEDLPQLISDNPDDQKWVVHFHVPVFLEKFGSLATSHDDVIECLRTISRLQTSDQSRIEFSGHLEIETYAWTVLPESMRQHSLAEDIASEVAWLGKVIETSSIES